MSTFKALASEIRSISQLREYLVSLGAKPIHIHRFFRAWLGKGPWPSEDDARFPKAMRLQMPALRAFLQGLIEIRSRHMGADPDSERLLLTLRDGQTIESVLLPRQGVCVSTQLGCAVGCVFCMTGKSGLIRQLSSLEIVAQVALARTLRAQTKKVVFMGMGEPSHNLEAVLEAVDVLGLHGDFAHKQLVISSVGDVRLFDLLMQRLADDRQVKPALAISLHTVDDALRQKLLPKGAKLDVQTLLNKAEAWARAIHYPTQIQWTLIKGVNDDLAQAQRLVQLIQGHYAMVNFIPVNEVPNSPYQRPSEQTMQALKQFIRSQGIVATFRDSAAQDVDGGCGQLRARVLIERQRVGKESH